LLKAANRLEGLDVRRSRETYLDALTAALFAGRLSKGVSALEGARAARAAPRPADPPRASDLLLDGLALLITDGYAAGTPVVQQALSALRAESVAIDERLRWSWLAGGAAGFIWDYDSWDMVTAGQVQVARDAGALTVLPLTLNARAGVQLVARELTAGGAWAGQVEAVADATDNCDVPNVALAVAAFRGREE